MVVLGQDIEPQVVLVVKFAPSMTAAAISVLMSVKEKLLRENYALWIKGLNK